MIPKKAQEILDFWFKETPAEKRFKKDEAFFFFQNRSKIILNRSNHQNVDFFDFCPIFTWGYGN